jgi:hypothetical protein
MKSPEEVCESGTYTIREARLDLQQGDLEEPMNYPGTEEIESQCDKKQGHKETELSSRRAQGG